MGEVAAADIERALEASRAREFVARLPDRLATHLGEQGSRLSGGQRQRIALARELLRQPHLLILDEATSGLDAETERELFEGLREFYPALTVLVITHRASNLRTVDRVLELRNGQICKAAPEEVAEQPTSAPVLAVTAR